jgi:SpoIID/LytB domain protein
MCAAPVRIDAGGCPAGGHADDQRVVPVAKLEQTRAVFRSLAAVMVLAVTAVAIPAAAPAAAQTGEPTVLIEGRGWGHGRGMSQHGALGYAVDHGWDWRRILGHYYSNTVEGNISPAAEPAVPGTVGVGVSAGAGYWLATATGAVVARDGAPFHGSMGGQRLTAPVLGMAPTPSGNGYWLVASDGGIFSFGNATFWGSTGAMRLNQPVVGMASSPTGLGYWLVARDGGIFSFGDARFFGSTGAIRLNQPIVGMAATPSGNGYWLVARDGGIFAFGDARFFGSTGAIRLNQPIMGMAPTRSGNGYWLVARDGGVFPFGDAVLHGSLPGRQVTAEVAGMAPTRQGSGYWLVSTDGRAYPFGDASVRITTRLVAQQGQDLVVFRPAGGLRTNATGGELAAAWRVRASGGGWLVDRGSTCSGPWTQVTPAPVTAAAIEVAAADPRDLSADPRELLGLCRPDGVRYYRGQLHAYREAGVVQTRNAVELELYLRGVVPRESPASWGGLGGGRGIHALAAQAVAARSYAWAENRGQGAKTCDTTACQVYGGAFWHPAGGSVQALEDPRTDEAVRMTAGVIRLLNGAPARTEYSSSTGGWTAGGTFPAVEDVGDAYAGNPVHTWTERIRVAAIEAAWPQIGPFAGIEVLTRNGLGAWGGRVTRVRISGAGGAVEVTGDQFRAALAAEAACVLPAGRTRLLGGQCMKSNWFNVPVTVPMGPASIDPAPSSPNSGPAELAATADPTAPPPAQGDGDPQQLGEEASDG